MSIYSLPEQFKIVEMLAQATDAGGRTGAYVSLKNANIAWIVVHMDQGAANTVALTINQATSAAAGGAKAITVTVPIWSNLDCALTDTLVRRTDAVSYTTDAGVKHKQVIFQIDPDTLDLANGFCYIAVITGASSASNLTEAQIYLRMRYEQATPPTAIT